MKGILISITMLAWMSCVSQSSEFATARITDVCYGLDVPRIVVAFEGKTKVIQLKKYGGNPLDDVENGNFDLTMAENLSRINVFLDDMNKKGYTLLESNTSVNNGHFTFMVFRRLRE